MAYIGVYVLVNAAAQNIGMFPPPKDLPLKILGG